MRDKIAEICKTAACFGKYSADVVWEEGLEEATEGYADQILTLITEEIEKVENPYTLEEAKEYAEEFRQVILALLKK